MTAAVVVFVLFCVVVLVLGVVIAVPDRDQHEHDR